MSASIVEFISQRLDGLEVFVEFGSGSSTRYFLSEIIEKRKAFRFISVERSQSWFEYVRDAIKADLGDSELSERDAYKGPWTMERVDLYARSDNQTRLDVPIELRRLPGAQRNMRGNILRKLLMNVFTGKRPYDGRYSVLIDGRVHFTYALISEPMKDQYGESPLKMDYINAGLDPVRELLQGGSDVKVGFMVDGGPRGDIVHAILDLEEERPNLYPSIFVLEAQRVFYKDAFARRESGVFVQGTGKMLNGDFDYRVPKDRAKNEYWYDQPEITIEQMLSREMWYYQRDESSESR